MTSSSSHPPKSIPPFTPLPLRPLKEYPQIQPAEISPHTEGLLLPSPTQPQGIPYTVSTHIIPATRWRLGPDIPLPDADLPVSINASKEARKERNEAVYQKLVRMRDATWGNEGQGSSGVGYDTSATSQHGEKVLANCINRYVRNDLLVSPSSMGTERKGVTLMFAHANGFPKEIWDPTIAKLLVDPMVSAIVDEVWLWESVQHGDSCVLNASKLGGIFNWNDNARDILNFLLHYLPDSPRGTLPTYLPKVSPSETQNRKEHGFSSRQFIVAGHSFGGCSSALAALSYPALFSSLIMIDPVIIHPGSDQKYTIALIRGALNRRDGWTSREEALKSFRSNPFFASWDPEVLKVYSERGLYESPTGELKLKTPGVQEAIVYLDTRTSNEVFQRLIDLDKRIEIRWVMPDGSGSYEVGGAGHAPILCSRRLKNSSNIKIPHTTHLIPQEAPSALASEVGDFLKRNYGQNLTLKGRL